MFLWNILRNIKNFFDIANSDKNLLLELYRNTLEELRHHERTYIYLVTGMVLIMPILMSAFGLLLNSEILIKPEFTQNIKWVFLIGLIILSIFFWVLIFRLERKRKLCITTLQIIEELIKNRNDDLNLEELLIISKFQEKSFDMFVEKYRIWMYIVVNVLVIVILWYALFNWIS